MSIRPDATHKKLNPASFRDFSLVLETFGFKIGRISIENVDVGRVNVNVLKMRETSNDIIAVNVGWVSVNVLKMRETSNDIIAISIGRVNANVLKKERNEESQLFLVHAELG